MKLSCQHSSSAARRPLVLATFALLTVLAACGKALAQPAPLPERPPPGHTRALSVPQTSTPPVIDGILDDAGWEGAAVASQFWISEQQRWPTEQTEVWVTADLDNLYFGFKVYDSKPEQIEALQTRRDAGLGLDDQVTVRLDPFLSYREVSGYSVNAAGTQSDEIAGGRARQLAWKGDWRAAAVRTLYGWSAEMAIPFAILNFEAGATTFGVNFQRYHHRTSELSRWADLTVRLIPEERGVLKDLTPPRTPSRRPWTFLPYVLLGHNVPNKRGEVKDTFATAGADIRYQPSPNLTGVIALNPDFSQVETAITDVDFTYNEKLRADNRPFFQEGSAYFGGVPEYFYSNRVPAFDFGGKFFTRTRGYQVGALATRAPDDRTDAVFRLQREVGATHSFGGMIVATDRADLRNALYVLQAQGREPSGFRYAVDGAVTETDRAPGDGTFVQGNVGWDRDFWSVGVTATRYSLHYFPADAFLAADLPDTAGGTAYATYSHDFGPGPIRLIAADLSWTHRDTGDGRLQRNKGYIGGAIEFQQEIKLSAALNAGPYRPVGAEPGSWFDTLNHDRYWSGAVDFNTRSSRFSYGAYHASGFVGGGDYEYTSLYAWARPTRTTFVTASAERLDSFGHTDQVVLSAGWDITPRHSIYGRYVWSEDGRYARLAYSYHVATNIDLFAVYDEIPGREPQISGKVVMTFP